MDHAAIASVTNQVVEEISVSNTPPIVEGIQDLVEKHLILGKYSGLGFGAVNHKVDFDPVCHYHGILGNECPNCHRTEDDGLPKFERIRRISGYLVGTLDRWNL